MHRSRYIETTTLPKLGEGTSSITEAEQPTPAIPREDLSELPKVPAESGLPKITRALAITPNRRRRASVLDAVMDTTRALTSAPAKKIVEAAISHAEPEAH